MSNPILQNCTSIVHKLVEIEEKNDDTAYVDGPTLQGITGLSPKQINDAVEALDNSGYIDRQNYLGTAPFNFGLLNVTPSGKMAYYEAKKTNTENVSDEGKKYFMDIFISHSSQDVDIAKALINLIRSALNITASKIRCTSASGYKLQIGVNTDEQLRKEIFSSKVFIGIISPASIESTYVLFELGARWGISEPLLPLVVKTSGTEFLQGPMRNINALFGSKEEDLYQFVSDLSRYLNIQAETPAVYKEEIITLVNLSQPLFITTETEASFPGGIGAWKRFLERNLNSEILSKQSAPDGRYEVAVNFKIDIDGKVIDVRAENDPGFGAAKEAIRVIQESPKWIPANQNGKNVVYRQRQTITFVVA